jgi:hypothetical protein
MNYNTHMIARDEHKHMTESIVVPGENDLLPAERKPVRRLVNVFRPALAAIVNLVIRSS